MAAELELEFLRLLSDVSDALSRVELEGLRFLCRDLLPEARLGGLESGLGLFSELQDQALLAPGNTLLLAELLFTIGRLRLLRLISWDTAILTRELSQPGRAHLTPYRHLLYNICENVTSRELPTVKHFLNNILHKSELEKIKTMFDAVVEMEKKDQLSPDNTQFLEVICGQFSKDLLKKLKDYSEKCKGEGRSRAVMETGDSLKSPIPERGAHGFQMSSSYDLDADPDNMLNKLSISDRHKGPGIETQVRHRERTQASPQNSEEFYRMEHVPRGYCIIINNQSFTNMSPRPGTDLDEDALEEIFTWLQFQVKVYRDLTSEEMVQTLKKYQGKIQQDQDCFVCCLLSHGEEGTIFGTCGNKLNIRNLTTLFSASNCPFLQQKPKVFFIQACQGKRRQDGVQVETDCETPVPAPAPATMLEEDAQRSSGPIIPDEADFLLGMATVEGYVSFRHVHEGTWYIQSLCANLREYCHSNDLLSILTIVNRDVSEKQDGKYKTQMPQPSYTLRKKLFFPVNNNNTIALI